MRVTRPKARPKFSILHSKESRRRTRQLRRADFVQPFHQPIVQIDLFREVAQDDLIG